MRPTLRAAALAAIVLATLTACEKPNPYVGIFSGDTSVRAEAVCWSGDGTPVIGAEGCTEADLVAALSSGDVPVLPVVPGGTIGISVDTEVAEAGWYPSIVVDGQAQQLATTPIHKRYWRMTFPEATRGQFPQGGYALQITALGATGGSQSGVWFFTLTDADAAE